MKRFKRMKRTKKEPAFAPGNEDMLQKSAGKDDVRKGAFTRITTLSYDEVDPS